MEDGKWVRRDKLHVGKVEENARMDIHHWIIPRKKRHRLLLFLFLLTILLLGIYINKSDVVSTLSTTSSSKSRMHPVNDHSHHVIHTIDHGCYLQTANFTHHLHSPHLLAERGCEKKLPIALIIGGALCGTRTLRSALSFHPDVVVPDGDTPVFQEKFVVNEEQYLGMMPFSRPTQITVDESPEFLYTPNCSKQFVDMIGPKLKVIALLRDPVVRAMTEYFMLTSPSRGAKYLESISQRQCFAKKINRTLTPINESVELEHDISTKSKRYVKKQFRRDKHHIKERQKERNKRKYKHHRNKRSAGEGKGPVPKGNPGKPYKGEEIDYDIKATCEETFFDEDKLVNGAHFLLQRSAYVPSLKKWRKAVQTDNMLILDAEEFARNPAGTMTMVEKFLGLEPYFKPDFFDFDLANGRLCFSAPVRSCVGTQMDEIRQHPVLADSLVSELREFFIPWIKIQNRLTRIYFPHLGEHPMIFTPFS